MANTVRGFFESLNRAFSTFQSKALRDVYGYMPNCYKRADQVFTASTAFADLTDLQVDLLPGRYRVTYILPLPATTAAGNLKLQLISSGGLTANSIQLTANFFLTAVAPASSAITNLAGTVSGGTTNAWTHCLVTGSIDIKDGGTLILQGAQVAASGATTVGKGAVVEVTQLTALA